MLTKGKASRLMNPIRCYPSFHHLHWSKGQIFLRHRPTWKVYFIESISANQVQGYNGLSDLYSLAQQIANNIPILWERHSKATVNAGVCTLKVQTCKQTRDSSWLRQVDCSQQETQGSHVSASSKEVLLLYSLRDYHQHYLAKSWYWILLFQQHSTINILTDKEKSL